MCLPAPTHKQISPTTGNKVKPETTTTHYRFSRHVVLRLSRCKGFAVFFVAKIGLVNYTVNYTVSRSAGIAWSPVRETLHNTPGPQMYAEDLQALNRP